MKTLSQWDVNLLFKKIKDGSFLCAIDRALTGFWGHNFTNGNDYRLCIAHSLLLRTKKSPNSIINLSNTAPGATPGGHWRANVSWHKPCIVIITSNHRTGGATRMSFNWRHENYITHFNHNSQYTIYLNTRAFYISDTIICWIIQIIMFIINPYGAGTVYMRLEVNYRPNKFNSSWLLECFLVDA